jgi:hypothetical protein
VQQSLADCNREIEEIKGFIFKHEQDLAIAQYGLEQQEKYCKKLEWELEELKRILEDMQNNKASLYPGED